MMHKYTLALIAATLLFAACRGPEPQPETQQPLPIVTLHGKSCFELTTRDTVPIIDDTYMDVENEFTINWPSLDSFPPATRRALIRMAFADSTSPPCDRPDNGFWHRPGWTMTIGKYWVAAPSTPYFTGPPTMPHLWAT